MTEIAFAAPRMLWLLMAPAILLVLWVWQVIRRQADRQWLRRTRTLPVAERYRRVGDLALWLPVVIAVGALILALARPTAPTTLPERAGVDVVVLQDASASMRVNDAAASPTANEGRAFSPAVGQDSSPRDRWQRSMRFLRELGDQLSWSDDRLAMIAFAHIATPQIRLTRDPNTLFFFLDHLYARPPFRLEDDTTWDTNLEEAVAWGLRLVEKDEEIHGRSGNAAVFLMLSDGEAWSGEVVKAVARVVDRGIPLYVVGVGTLGGGPLPIVRATDGELLDSPGTSRLERSSLQRIALAGRGRYFELDRDGDRQIATTIVADGRRLAPAVGLQEVSEELYWWFVAAASLIAAAGLALVTRRTELGILLAGSIATAVMILSVL
jgi:Ca-activated chloride channel family protein